MIITLRAGEARLECRQFKLYEKMTIKTSRIIWAIRDFFLFLPPKE